VIGRRERMVASIVDFEFVNNSDNLSLKLVLGPAEESQRNDLWHFMKEHEKVFTSLIAKEPPEKTNKHTFVLSIKVLSKNDYSKKDTIGLKKKIEDSWPKIVKKIQEIDDIFNNNWSG